MMARTGGRAAMLTGTAILSALVVVFDYALKFSGLKIPFPWMPFLKFDFTGIPVVVSLLLYGLSSAATTSVVACLAIVARSGDLVGGSMKSLAEFSTVLGIEACVWLAGKRDLNALYVKGASVVVGVFTRSITMGGANLAVLPVYYGTLFSVAVGMLPLLVVFNAIQGGMTVLLGYFLYEAYVRRIPIHKGRAPTNAA